MGWNRRGAADRSVQSFRWVNGDSPPRRMNAGTGWPIGVAVTHRGDHTDLLRDAGDHGGLDLGLTGFDAGGSDQWANNNLSFFVRTSARVPKTLLKSTRIGLHPNKDIEFPPLEPTLMKPTLLTWGSLPPWVPKTSASILRSMSCRKSMRSKSGAFRSPPPRFLDPRPPAGRCCAGAGPVCE